MKAYTGDAIRNVTLEARKLLMEEISEELEGIYGLLPDGRFRPIDQYPVLADNREAADTRRRLEILLAEERHAGLQPKEAREKLVKEAAFTWLNRFVAFKMMEARKLLRETITRGQDSNGFKMWLTESGNEAHLADYEQGDLPQDGLGEGPRQRAYRRFLLAQCAKLSREVRVLFDPDSLASRLCPRPKALRRLIDMLNAEKLLEAWQPGNEETIGWVYQTFTEPDLEIFQGQGSPKVPRHLVAAKTQKFTPRWIVRFLVENTLGRMWFDMHPDSQLASHLEYLVPLENQREMEIKSVRDIKLLDPACGTMHFGLVAFDLFVEMYREEMAHAGEPGWPEKPPVEREDDIPATIIARNIHGIDIDLRAVQLSALTLYLKAKTLNPKAKLSESRLAYANVHMSDGDRLQQFLQQTGIERPIYRRILAALQARLKDSEQLGSLLRLEQEISELVEQERKRYEKEGMPLFPGWTKEQFETQAGRREFWEMLELQIGQALDEFARQQAAASGLSASEGQAGNDHSFFTGETTKGLRLLEVMAERYDIVATNPPYLDSGDMNADLKQFIDSDYKYGKRNLYAAFSQRCLEFLLPHGTLGIITGQTFMFISSFEKLRYNLTTQGIIELLAQFDYGLFPGVRVDTVALILRKEEDEKTRNDSVGTYFRLVKEPDSDAKQRRFEEALANLLTNTEDPVVFRYRQGDFDAISGSPWVYWITPGLRKVFQFAPKMGEGANVCIGMRTGDNSRFLRFWWEVGFQRIAFSCKNAKKAKQTSNRWFPYMKGGGFCRWYGNQVYVVEWHNDGKIIKENTKHHYPQLGDNLGWKISNENYYFRRGVTYSYLTSGTFSARLSPGGFIFDVAGSSLFPEDVPLVLAVLNSSFALYALKLINPTVNFQVGDLARLPVPDASSDKLHNLVNQAIELAKADSQEDETTWDFIAPPDWPDGIRKVAERHARLAEIEREIDEEVYRLYGISEEDRRAIEAELAEPAEAESEDIEEGGPS